MKIYQIFISSPGDLLEERSIIKNVITQISPFTRISYKIDLRSVTWEDDSYPGFGEDPQDVLNGELPNDYDIYIGMMWKRIGQATRRYPSGTIEEFESAYSRYLNDQNSVKILFYFKEISETDIVKTDEGVKKVTEFKNSLRERGYFTWSDFKDAKIFETFIPLHIYKAIHELVNKRVSSNWSEDDDGRVPIIKSKIDTQSQVRRSLARQFQEIVKNRDIFLNNYSKKNVVLSTAEQRFPKKDHTVSKFNLIISQLQNELSESEVGIIDSLKILSESYMEFTKTWIKFFILMYPKGENYSVGDKTRDLEEIENTLRGIRELKSSVLQIQKKFSDYRVVFGQIKSIYGGLLQGVNFNRLDKLMLSEIKSSVMIEHHVDSWHQATEQVKEILEKNIVIEDTIK